MPGYRDLLGLIRAGCEPMEIRERLDVQPSILRRMLRCKALQRELDLDRELANIVLRHRLDMGRSWRVWRLEELSGCEQPETARKACESLLKLEPPPPEEQEPAPPKPPWMCLSPMDPRDREAVARKEQADQMYEWSITPPLTNEQIDAYRKAEAEAAQGPPEDYPGVVKPQVIQEASVM